jgi:hypothetical protein
LRGIGLRGKGVGSLLRGPLITNSPCTGGSFYIQDNVTRKQESLRTQDKATAERLLSARNKAARQPAINRAIAHA